MTNTTGHSTTPPSQFFRLLSHVQHAISIEAYAVTDCYVVLHPASQPTLGPVAPAPQHCGEKGRLSKMGAADFSVTAPFEAMPALTPGEIIQIPRKNFQALANHSCIEHACDKPISPQLRGSAHRLVDLAPHRSLSCVVVASTWYLEHVGPQAGTIPIIPLARITHPAAHHIVVSGPTGLSEKQWAMVEHLASIKIDSIVRILGKVDNQTMSSIRRALNQFFFSEHDPNGFS